METDFELDLSTTRMGTGKTMEIFPVLHRLNRETSHKIFLIANQEDISLTTLLSSDLTIDIRLFLRPIYKIFPKTIIRHLVIWFVSPQPTIPFTNRRILTLLRFPNSNTDKSRSSRLSLNIFYFATGYTQKDSVLEIEFMLHTGASCSIINYRTFLGNLPGTPLD